MHLKSLTVAATLIGISALAFAQTDGHGPSDGDGHSEHNNTGSSLLTEPGQGAFAALSETVAFLAADPDTDWDRVDITALRDHLIDMDRMVTYSEISSEQVPGGLRMIASGDAATLETLKRMVPAHSDQLRTDERWVVQVVPRSNDVELIVTSDDPSVTAQIRGLGFFGLMASQDHHREHHLLMALGTAAH